MTKEERKERRIYTRHRIIWHVLSTTMSPWVRLIYGYKCKAHVDIKGPYILLSNHQTNLDPFLLGMALKHQMYFVTSEQFFRRGLKSKIMQWAMGGISKIKGSSDKLTVLKTIRSLKEGKNVAIFPEGNRSFTGRGGTINVATGKLVKISGASLVTFRIEGGYFMFPRWGFGMRKGPLSGRIVNVYTPEKLKEMSPEEITEAVRNDILEDSFKTMEKDPHPYKGKNLAEGIECAYCVCPSCKSIGHIISSGNTVKCTSCGITAEMDYYQAFSPDFPVRNVSQWDDLQEEFYRNYVPTFTDPSVAIYSDTGYNLQTVKADHTTTPLGSGTFTLYCDRFTFTANPGTEQESVYTFPLDKVPDASVYGKSIFIYSDAEGNHYELNPENGKLINARKYLSAWQILTDRN